MKHGHKLRERAMRRGRSDEFTENHGSGGRRMGGRGHGQRRGGRRRMYDGAELRLVLLHLIAEEQRHGYDLIRAIETLSGGAYAPSPGMVYPALSFLEDAGQIEALEANGARKAFAITDQGQEELNASAASIPGLLARLATLASEKERLDAAPIMRAMDNVKAALRARLNADNATKDMVHDIAAILDDATQKIERL